MGNELMLVLGLLGAAIVMFVANRPRMDVVALIMMVSLPLTGVITMPEALAGFADPNIILIAALFVIGEGLVRTGITQRMSAWIIRRAGRSEARLILFLMIAAASLSSFMSSTGVVAIFVPIVLRIAAGAGLSPGRLMMPLALAAMISGMLTLVATPPNLVVHAELVRRGFDGFSFFAFAPVGLPVLALAIGYMLLMRRHLGSAAPADGPKGRRLDDWIGDYALESREHRLRVLPGSWLAGRRLESLDLRGSAGVNLIAVERAGRFGRHLLWPKGQTLLQEGDVLLIDQPSDADFDLQAFARRFRLEEMGPPRGYFSDRQQEIGMAEVMIPPGSRLVGRTLLSAAFRSQHDLNAIGLRRGSDPLTTPLARERLRAGDTLLVVGPWRAIRRLEGERRDLLLLALPDEADAVAPDAARAPQALAVLALVVAAMVTGILPNVQAALMGCLLMGLLRCIDLTSAYRAIHWQSLILIVGMLPFSLALERTGGIDLAATFLMDQLGQADPRLVLAALFAATTAMSLFISNTATAVLMAPVALALAEMMGVSPLPLAMTVALAASAAFMTPVSSPVNTLVVGPGAYRFMDFVRIGTPLWIITLIVCTALIPLVAPF